MDYDRLAKMLGKALSKGEEVEDTARTIKASQNIEDLTGKGTEYLLSPEGEVRARFTDGNMVPNPVGSNEPTVGSAIPGLPMDEASRMARAREMGFNPDQTLYHGTTANFDSFQPSPADRFVGPGVYFATDPRNARGSLDGAGSNIIPAYARGNIFEWPQKPVSDKYSTEIHDNIAKYLGYNNVDDLYKGLHAKYPEAWEGGQPIHVAIQNELKNQGYTGVNFGPGSGTFRQTVMFDPKDIRSKFAAFDPAQANSSNLSAGLAGAALGAGALGAAALSPQDAQANIDTEAMNEMRPLMTSGRVRGGKVAAEALGASGDSLEDAQAGTDSANDAKTAMAPWQVPSVPSPPGMLSQAAHDFNHEVLEPIMPGYMDYLKSAGHMVGQGLDTLDKYTGRPVRAAAYGALSEQNPFETAYDSVANDEDVPSSQVADAFLHRAEDAGLPLRAPGQKEYPVAPFAGAALGTVLDPTPLVPFGRLKRLLVP